MSSSPSIIKFNKYLLLSLYTNAHHITVSQVLNYSSHVKEIDH